MKSAEVLLVNRGSVESKNVGLRLKGRGAKGFPFGFFLSIRHWRFIFLLHCKVFNSCRKAAPRDQLFLPFLNVNVVFQLKFDTVDLIGILEHVFKQLQVDPSKHKVGIEVKSNVVYDGTI